MLVQLLSVHGLKTIFSILTIFKKHVIHFGTIVKCAWTKTYFPYQLFNQHGM